MSEKLKFFVPAEITKGEDSKGRETMVIKGIASTGDLDSENEYLDPSGMDLSGFKWVNWNHLGSKDPSTIIGEPVKKVITPDNKLYIEAVLYPEVPMAQTAYNLMKALQSSPNGNKLGFSVEGKVLQKDPIKKNRISKSRITGVALCPVPINGKTWAEIVKGEVPDENEIYDNDFLKLIIDNTESTDNMQELSKSDVVDTLFEELQDTEQVKLVYPIVERISVMNNKPFSKETISKAMQILDLVENPQTTTTEFDSELFEKAESELADLLDAGHEEGEAKTKLIRKGYNTELIEAVLRGDRPSEDEDIAKAMSNFSGALVETEKMVDRRLSATADALEAISKENEVLKAQVESLSKSLETFQPLKEAFGKFLDTPKKGKFISKGAAERFPTEKNSDEPKVVNVNDKQQRSILKAQLNELSGLNDGQVKDQRLVRIAQNLELAGAAGLDKNDVAHLSKLGYQIIAE